MLLLYPADICPSENLDSSATTTFRSLRWFRAQSQRFVMLCRRSSGKSSKL